MVRRRIFRRSCRRARVEDAAARKEAQDAAPSRRGRLSPAANDSLRAVASDASAADADPAKSAAGTAQNFAGASQHRAARGRAAGAPETATHRERASGPAAESSARSLAASNVAAPEISAQEKQAGAINIASSSQAPAKPLLPVNPMSAPRARSRKKRTRTQPRRTSLDGRRRTETLIALSATPAPVAPPPRSRPEIFRRAFRFRRTDRKPGTPGGTRPAPALAEAMREAEEATAPKAFSSAAEMPQTPVRFQAWASARRRGESAMRCPRGRFRARALAPDDSKSCPRMHEGAAQCRSEIGIVRRRKCSAQNASTRCTSICRI